MLERAQAHKEPIRRFVSRKVCASVRGGAVHARRDRGRNGEPERGAELQVCVEDRAEERGAFVQHDGRPGERRT